MLICESCYEKPICKIFEKNEELSDSILMSVERCKYYNNKTDNISEIQTHNINTIQDRIKNIQALSEGRELKKNEIKVCETCGTESEDCVKCDNCGDWICNECATTLINGETLCEQCYKN